MTNIYINIGQGSQNESKAEKQKSNVEDVSTDMPNDFNKKKEDIAKKFPSEWPTGQDMLPLYLITEVDLASDLTKEIYKEVDNGTISASISIHPSSNSTSVGIFLTKGKDSKDADEKRSNLIKRLSERVKGFFEIS